MRIIVALTFGMALVLAGCNSKPSESEAVAEPGATSEPRQQAKAVFRDRSALKAGSSNEVIASATPTPPAKARSLLPRPTIQSGLVSAPPDEQPVESDASGEAPVEEVRPEDIPEEGDEILIPPKMLSLLLPGTNFDSVQREEPINVKSLLDQQGIVLTNYQQLVELGITNYQIVRAQRPVEGGSDK
ncbi:MAG: hypothetical protein L0Z50_01555 [Verrucomicrobiales bacterium]|nr:hypothetical protein [Verrucomicrobiales bacterium]